MAQNAAFAPPTRRSTCARRFDGAHLPQKKDCSMLGIANIFESCVDHDSAVWAAIVDEGHRQDRSIELIASENIDRKSVVSGKSVSVRVDLGGSRIIKKKKK